MSLAIQNILTLIIVASCVVWVGWQCVGTVFGKKSKLGSCCAKGCQTATKPTTNRIHFMPVEMLAKKK